LLGVCGTCCPDTCAAPAEVCEEACDAACADECGAGDVVTDEAWTLSGAVLGEDSPFTIGGWFQAGYHNRSTGLFNSHPDQLVSHQNWLYAERVADGSEGLDFGFRSDLLYGADAQDTQAFGEPFPQDHWDTDWDHGIYGWALPQLYAEAAYGDLSVKVGHFFALHGYEVVAAPDNFFYSHSFTFYNSEPFTHTGALASYNATDSTTLHGGWVAGWDTGFDRFSDGDDSKGSAAMFGVSQGFGDDLTVTYIGMAGDMGVRGEGYNHSVVADFALTDNLNYVLQSDLLELNAAGGLNHSIGLNNFLFYTLTEKVAVGGRAEWYKAKFDNAALDDGSVYQVTGGLNVKPTANLAIRPEIRYQWGEDDVLSGFQGAFNDRGATGQPGVDEQAIFGIDAILTF
ncbi:MAG TPA: outer membrane beta-barrel protein, partial [Planctomycetaceae bacterium]